MQFLQLLLSRFLSPLGADEFWNEYNIDQKCQCVMVVLAAVLKVTKQQLDTKRFSGLKLAKVCTKDIYQINYKGYYVSLKITSHLLK